MVPFLGETNIYVLCVIGSLNVGLHFRFDTLLTITQVESRELETNQSAECDRNYLGHLLPQSYLKQF